MTSPIARTWTGLACWPREPRARHGRSHRGGVAAVRRRAARVPFPGPSRPARHRAVGARHSHPGRHPGRRRRLRRAHLGTPPRRPCRERSPRRRPASHGPVRVSSAWARWAGRCPRRPAWPTTVDLGDASHIFCLPHSEPDEPGLASNLPGKAVRAGHPPEANDAVARSNLKRRQHEPARVEWSSHRARREPQVGNDPAGAHDEASSGVAQVAAPRMRSRA